MLTQDKIYNLALRRLCEVNRQYAVNVRGRQLRLMSSEIEQIVQALDDKNLLTKLPLSPDRDNQWDDPTWRVTEDGRKVGSVSVNLDYTVNINKDQMSFGSPELAIEWARAIETAGTFAILDRIDSNSGSPPDPLILDYDCVKKEYLCFDIVKEVIREINIAQAKRPGTPVLSDKTIEQMVISLFTDNLVYFGLPEYWFDYSGRAAIWQVNCKDDSAGVVELWGRSVFFENHDLTLKDGLHAVMVARALKAAAMCRLL